MLTFLKEWWCRRFHEKYWVVYIFRGTLQHGVKFIHCPRCNCRYVMSDAHRSFLRYDNDEELIKGLCSVYQIERYLLFQ